LIADRPIDRRRLANMRLAGAIVQGLLVGCSGAPSGAAPDSGANSSVDAAACGFGCGPDVTPEMLDASLVRKVEARLALCNGQEGCHVSGAGGGLFYPPGNELVDLIDVRASERPDLVRVKPGDPLASYLYLKVRGDGGIEGGAMPLGVTPRDPRIAETIFAWIEAGARQE
jgi:hypothetical protein